MITPADRGQRHEHAAGPGPGLAGGGVGRLAGTTPAPGDVGDADPGFAAALAAADLPRVLELLPAVRLLVPVVAVPGGGDAEMAVPALVNEAGRRALPVFTGLDSLRAWQAEARPVPMPGARVLAAAAAEDYDGLVVDVAGPAPCTLEREVIRALAAALEH